MFDRIKSYYKKFEEIGEDKVREEMDLGNYGEARIRAANAWLAQRKREREELVSSLAVDREERIISIMIEQRDDALSATKIARSARNAAWVAAIAAIIAAAAAIITA